jgi:transporter family protein
LARPHPFPLPRAGEGEGEGNLAQGGKGIRLLSYGSPNKIALMKIMSLQLWAVLSAVFAALTAIFAKIGVENINSDLATFIRTLVIAAVLAIILLATGQFQAPDQLSSRTILFLVLSGLATGASWLCYFRALKLGNASQVAPIDKLSVVLVAFLGVTLLGELLSPANWIGIVLIAAGAIFVGFK